MKMDDSKLVNAWILCSCGKKHKLIPGIDAPVYWCENELLNLKEGDDLEIRDWRKRDEKTTL